jgi:hypothetical protein
MNFPKFFISTVIIVLFSLNTKEIASLSFPCHNTIFKNVVDEKIQGGPRTVIQGMTTVTVGQSTPTNLYITIVDSEGTIVIEQVTQALQTTISTVGLKGGTYIVKTVDDDDDVQVFTITI